jgi:hypothetical protein
MPDDEQHPKSDEAEKPAEAAADKPEPEATEEGDKFRPEAIAARIEAIGEEDEADRIARQEEQKLLERKKGKKGGKKGLESAASKRLAKIGETKVKRPGALGEAAVTPDADPLLERAARAGKWIQEHRQTFGGLVAIGLLGAGGLFGWFYWQGKHQADASAMLAQGIADEHGRISDKDDDDDEDTTAKHQGMYPTFKSTSDRTAAALAKYRDVEAKYPGTGAAILARLSEGGLLLDSGDAKGALAAYGDVKGSPLAQADVEVRGRAIEGIGFADELLAKTDEGNKDKHLDEALAAYKDLESVDMKGFKELGQYHEARVQQAKGDKAKAIELLKAVHEKVSDLGETHPFSYLEFVVEDRLRELDPTALPPKSSMPHGPPGGGAGAGPGGMDTSDPKIQELLKKLQLQMQQGGGAPGAPGAPGLPPGLPPPPPSPPK